MKKSFNLRQGFLYLLPLSKTKKENWSQYFGRTMRIKIRISVELWLLKSSLDFEFIKPTLKQSWQQACLTRSMFKHWIEENVLGWLAGWFMVFNATFNNISVISWQSVLLVGETGLHGENHWPVASHWQSWSHNVVEYTLPWMWKCINHGSTKYELEVMTWREDEKCYGEIFVKNVWSYL